MRKNTSGKDKTGSAGKGEIGKRGKTQSKKTSIGSTSSALATGTTGAAGIISAHNVCHAVCLGVVAVLSVFGIALSSTALMFLQDYNFLFWSMGLFFLLVSAALYVRLSCVSTKAMTANAGIIIAGVPFFPSAQLSFWIVGGAVFIIVFGRYLLDKFWAKRR